MSSRLSKLFSYIMSLKKIRSFGEIDPWGTLCSEVDRA